MFFVLFDHFIYEWIFVSKSSRYWCSWLVVSTGWCNVPHSRRNHRFIERKFSWKNHLKKWTRELAYKILCFDAVGLLLLGLTKSLVYVDKAQLIDALKANITRVINGIPDDILERVLENYTHRMDHVRASCGQHLNEIIFKY